MTTRGYTSLEIAVVLVSIGALAATAIPQFSAAQARLAVRHAADEFVAAHQLTRAVALRSGRVAELRIDATAGRFWVEIDTSVARIGVTDTIGAVRSVSTNNVSMTSTRGLLCFDGRGLATPVWACPPANATVTFNRGEFADTVKTTLTGKILR